MNADQAAAWMNARWSAFDENDDSTHVGITIQVSPSPDSDFVTGFFCSSVERPPGYPKTGCHNGWCDCRLSSSLYNHKMIVTPAGLPKLIPGVGMVLNQDKVETAWAKCSYVGDGGTVSRYNNGCGGPSAHLDCDNRYSAFSNICPSTNSICTADAKEVKSSLATPFGPLKPEIGGVFPDAAFDYHMQSNWTAGQSHLRDMAKARLQGSTTADKWNEVVIDVRLLTPMLTTNPEQVLLAVVYPESNMAFKGIAANFARNYEKHFGVKIPVIKAKDVSGSATAPFVADDANEVIV